MREKLLRLSEVTEADWKAWTALAKRAAEPNGALDPRFLAPEQAGPQGDHMLLVALDGLEWIGLLRVFPVDTPVELDLRAFGTYEPAAIGSSYPLLDRMRASEALASLARGHRRLLRNGYLLLRSYPADGPLAEALDRARQRPNLSTRTLATHPAPWLFVEPGTDPAPNGERVFPAHVDPEHRSASTRKELRRHARRLVEAGGGSLTLRDVSDDPSAIDRFVAIQAAGWKGDLARGGYAVSLDAWRERSFREKADAFRASGDLIVLELWAGPEHVYTGTLLVSGDVAMGFLDAYVDEYGGFSVGTLARTAVCEHLRHRSNLTAVNPAVYYYGSESTKNFPHQRDLVDLLIGVGYLPSLIVRLLPTADSSHWGRKALSALNRLDRGAMRLVDALRRARPVKHRSSA